MPHLPTVPCVTSKPEGIDQPRRIWKTHNRMRTNFKPFVVHENASMRRNLWTRKR